MRVFEKLKRESKESNLNNFVNEFKSKSFYDTYESLYNTSNIVKYINNGISIVFCFCFFSLAFKELNVYISLLLSFACTGMIEVIKTKVINVSALSYFKRGYTSFTVTAIVSVGFLALSVYTSLIGSKRFNNLTNESVNIIQQDNDNKRAELIKDYTDRILKAKDESKQFYEANKVFHQGGFRVDYRSKKQYNKMKDEVLRLEQLKDETLINFDTQANESVIDAESEKTNVSMYFMCISIINEMLLLSCIWFSKYFSFVAYKESKNIPEEHVNTNDLRLEELDQIEQIKGEQKSDIYEQISNKIGFDISDRIDTKDLNYLSKYPYIVNALLDGHTPYRVVKDKIGKQTTVYKCRDILTAIQQQKEHDKY